MKTHWMGMAAMAALCVGALRAPAQTPRITGIAHIALRVSDLDKEEAFLGKFGFEESVVLINGSGSTERMQVFMKINDDQFIELYSRNNPRQTLGLVHISYLADDLRGLHALYVQRGVNPPPVVETQAHNLLFEFRDPDGLFNEFTQYMPDGLQAIDRGKHLGPGRISDELLGFTLPVNNLAADRRFYTRLGFEARSVNGNVRLSLPGNPDLRIELRPVRPGGEPQYLLPVADARRAAQQLRHAGVNARQQGDLVFVHDPDGNAFVLLGATSHRLTDAIPWVH
jgi:catechol 2,3-dioxygenase-like lactoylglutathione lyase family enzyme